jgi:NAD(P)-dependent dehydrogenase (short-subunit alcohol dehydrogenase family)
VLKIRVNSISPGYMDTRLSSSSDLQDALPIWWERTPMGRIGGEGELYWANSLASKRSRLVHDWL